MNKKIILPAAVLLIVSVIFSFSSCTKKKPNNGEITTEKGTTATVTENKSTSPVVSQSAANTSEAAQSTDKTEKTDSTAKTEAPAKTEKTEPNNAAVNTKAPTKAETPANDGSSGGSFSSGDIKITVNGVSMRPNTAWSEYSSALGAPSNTTQAPSCHFDGMDNIYEYSGFSVYTYRDGGEDYVYNIEVTSSSYSTNKGIRVGSSEGDVISAYGTSYANKSDSLIEYRSGSKSIYFSLNGGKVSMMEFYCD